MQVVVSKQSSNLIRYDNEVQCYLKRVLSSGKQKIFTHFYLKLIKTGPVYDKISNKN